MWQKTTEYYGKHSRCYKGPRSSFNSIGKILTPCQSPQRVRWLKKCIGMQCFRSQKSVCWTKNVALLVLHQLRFSRLQIFKECEEFSTCWCYLGASLINRLESMAHPSWNWYIFHGCIFASPLSFNSVICWFPSVNQS